MLQLHYKIKYLNSKAVAKSAIFTVNQFFANMKTEGNVDDSIKYATALRICPKLMAAIAHSNFDVIGIGYWIRCTNAADACRCCFGGLLLDCHYCYLFSRFYKTDLFRQKEKLKGK